MFYTFGTTMSCATLCMTLKHQKHHISPRLI